ncbi:MAG: class II fructose-bisphosphate aldolase [Candidatus Omnitrophica bacterium]|nr:class II fructose-bisphosphate aldolase [Candidatus Omnitrophota bacterium]
MEEKTNNLLERVKELSLSDDMKIKEEIGRDFFELAKNKGIYSSSINDLYMARGKNEFAPNFTVPAINIRTMTLDLARAIFRAAKRINAGTFIFEIAKTEMGYTNQPPIEYSTNVLAAAICENWSGPVFIQGDHFQMKAKKFMESSEKEIEALKKVISDAIEAGFYNIDIDSSTLVDLSKPDIKTQQYLNYDVCAWLTNFIRHSQPRGIKVSVGGEIGEIGQKNSTPEELRGFIEGYQQRLPEGVTGLSKISVQTGTSHGGVVLPDGSIAEVAIDFNTLKQLSRIARKEFGLAGAVQHGASTLPSEAFHKFVECETVEVHLATDFQNMVYESKHFPQDLRERMYDWLRENLAGEKKEGQTDEQFIYKTRKKALGTFKKEILGLKQEVRDAITAEVEKKFAFLFEQLNIANTKDLVDKYI